MPDVPMLIATHFGIGPFKKQNPGVSAGVRERKTDGVRQSRLVIS
jgi:hypothetical protein